MLPHLSKTLASSSRLRHYSALAGPSSSPLVDLTATPPARSAPAPSVYTPRAKPEAKQLSSRPDKKATTDLLRGHLATFPSFASLPRAEQRGVESRIRRRVVLAKSVSLTLAEIYSDPRPLLDSRRMFGVDQDFMQPASWKAKVGDRILTPFNSYGTITKIRPGRLTDNQRIQAARAARHAILAAEDGAAKAGMSVKPKRLDIQMPSDSFLRTSRDGPDAGVVARKLREMDGMKGRGPQLKMVVEVDIETEIHSRKVVAAHPLDAIRSAPLSRDWVDKLEAETKGLTSIGAVRSSSFKPSYKYIAGEEGILRPRTGRDSRQHERKPLSQERQKERVGSGFASAASDP